MIPLPFPAIEGHAAERVLLHKIALLAHGVRTAFDTANGESPVLRMHSYVISIRSRGGATSIPMIGNVLFARLESLRRKCQHFTDP